VISSYPIDTISKSSSIRTSRETESEFKSMMLIISEPIVISFGFVSITITSTWSIQAVGAGGKETADNDGSPVGSQTIGLHGTSKTITMYPSVESLGRVQASHSSISKSSPM